MLLQVIDLDVRIVSKNFAAWKALQVAPSISPILGFQFGFQLDLDFLLRSHYTKRIDVGHREMRRRRR